MNESDKIFSELYPILYAAETPISGSYLRQSEILAAYADAFYGLRSADILDIGCGYGTTTMAVTNYAPHKIVAMDTSSETLELMKNILLSDIDMETYIQSLGGKRAEELLGAFYPTVVKHLQQRRAEFLRGAFYRNGGKLEIKQVSIIDLKQEDLGFFDVVISNNALHWPINQRKSLLQKENPSLVDDQLNSVAIGDILKSIGNVLPNGGLLAFLEPKDWVKVDDDPELELDYEKYSMLSHPIFIKFHETFNRFLKEKFNIDRAIPEATHLFKTSLFKKICEESGFKLEKLTNFEISFSCSPLTYFFVRLPLVLSGINISFEDKIKLGHLVQEELIKTLDSELLNMPVRGQYFVFILRRFDINKVIL